MTRAVALQDTDIIGVTGVIRHSQVELTIVVEVICHQVILG